MTIKAACNLSAYCFLNGKKMKNLKGHISAILTVGKQSFTLFRRADPLILSSSTAFFATFALSPIFLLLVNLFGLYFKSDRIATRLFGKLGSVIGIEAAREIENIVSNFMEFETNAWMTISGIIFFLFVSTTLLKVVKKNIHKLWQIRTSKRKLKQTVGERTTLAFLILMTGGLVLISLLIDSSLALSLEYLESIMPAIAIRLIHVLNFVFSLSIITVWFAILFKMLPDARVDWEIAFNGAFVTAVLYTAGKYALGRFLIHAQLASIFGASASFAILLLFIFYCSFIVYYGAAFTFELSKVSSRPIAATKNSRHYEERLLDSDA